MTLSSLTVTRNYAENKPWNKLRVDEIVDSIESWSSQVSAKVLDATDAYIYRAAGTDVPITDGGTGVSTLPTGFLIGAGTGAITALNNIAWSTFTPTVTLVGGAGNVVPVYTTNTGRYRRIADVVFVDIYLTGDGGAEGAGTGQFNIALPVAASASTPTEISPMGYVNNGANQWIGHGQIAPSATTILLVLQTTATTIGTMTGADQNNATRSIRLRFFYEV